MDRWMNHLVAYVVRIGCLKLSSYSLSHLGNLLIVPTGWIW
jgi:hypothetical protein